MSRLPEINSMHSLETIGQQLEKVHNLFRDNRLQEAHLALLHARRAVHALKDAQVLPPCLQNLTGDQWDAIAIKLELPALEQKVEDMETQLNNLR